MSGRLLPIVENQSAMKTFQNCQRLFGWEQLERLMPAGGRRSALAIGTAVHAGLGVFHAGGIVLPPAPSPDASPAEQEEYVALQALAKKSKPDQAVVIARHVLRKEAGAVSSFEDKSFEEARDIVERVLPAYFKHWEAHGELWKPINQEIQFLVPVGDPSLNVWLRGRADNLSIAKGGLYLVDYKTAGRMDPRDLLKYELDIQLSSYIYGLSKHLTKEAGEPIVIRGAIIDVLVKTATPQFARELYTRTDEELEEFEQEWIELSERIREQRARVAAGENWKTVFPKNTEHCFRYGTCAYRDICLKDTPVRRKLYVRKEKDYVDDAYLQLLREQGFGAEADSFQSVVVPPQAPPRTEDEAAANV